MTCLEVRDRDGHILLELDAHGRLVRCRDDLDIINLVPERIVEAAAGGLDVKHLPDELKTVYCDDVELVNYGVSWANKGPWIMLRLPNEAAFERFKAIDIAALQRQLDARQSTLRAVIFEADLVHREAEPLYPAAGSWAHDLQSSGFFASADVRAQIKAHLNSAGSDDGEAVLAACLAQRLGYESIHHVPPEAVYLWAVDNGVADELPDGYRVMIREAL